MQGRCNVKAFLSPLSMEEEKLCLERLKQGDTRAKEELILHNMRLVAHVAKKYQSSEDEVEDLISIGTIGLLKAVSTFDYNFGNRFATYAIRCIENELLMHFRKTKRNKLEVSLYEPIGTDKEGKQIHLMEVLLVDEVDIAKQMEINRDVELIIKYMEKVLTEREYQIIKKRYGLFGEREYTQREIAEELNISRSYISRIEKKALEKLKKVLN
ncbi:MAG: RNA polymerase sporulation sigma factor SigK [Agathobacter sp.]|nr:RNA polymerase sporulation sigma factor SigK [Agathobacter sp.]